MSRKGPNLEVLRLCSLISFILGLGLIALLVFGLVPAVIDTSEKSELLSSPPTPLLENKASLGYKHNVLDFAASGELITSHRGADDWQRR